MKILHIGDVVGKPGRKILADKLPGFMESNGIDFCVVNAENSAGGSGITPKCFSEVISAGADCVTLGDHALKQKEAVEMLTTESRLLRPANYPPESPGRGFSLYKTKSGLQALVCIVVGRVFMGAADCPFRTVDKILEAEGDKAMLRIVEIHAEATSEKIALARHLDGRVSAVVGTHTHVPTADAQILSGGTAFITDMGMTGPHDGVIGRRADEVLKSFLLNMPMAFDVSKKDVRINGVLLEVDEDSGKAVDIRRVQILQDAEGDING